jgi:hypothetical protein
MTIATWMQPGAVQQACTVALCTAGCMSAKLCLAAARD